MTQKHSKVLALEYVMKLQEIGKLELTKDQRALIKQAYLAGFSIGIDRAMSVVWDSSGDPTGCITDALRDIK